MFNERDSDAKHTSVEFTQAYSIWRTTYQIGSNFPDYRFVCCKESPYAQVPWAICSLVWFTGRITSSDMVGHVLVAQRLWTIANWRRTCCYPVHEDFQTMVWSSSGGCVNPPAFLPLFSKVQVGFQSHIDKSWRQLAHNPWTVIYYG